MRINNVDLHVQIAGDGPSFIWGHGLTSSIEAEDALDWFRWKAFSKQIKLVRYDARGHGKSQPSYRREHYRWHDLGQDMLALADATGSASFIAAGASMGCATALHAALQAPERIKALVLVIPPTMWETRATQGTMYRRTALLGALLGGRVLGKLMIRELARVLPAWLADAEPKKSRGLGLGPRALARRSLWHLFRGAAMSDLPPRAALAMLADIPTLILAWSGDPAHPLSSAEELHQLLPRSTLFVARNYEEFKTIPARMHAFIALHASQA